MLKKVIAVLCVACTALCLYAVFLHKPIDNQSLCNTLDQRVKNVAVYLPAAEADFEKYNEYERVWADVHAAIYNVGETGQCYDDWGKSVKLLKRLRVDFRILKQEHVTAAGLLQHSCAKPRSPIIELHKMRMTIRRLQSALWNLYKGLQAGTKANEQTIASCAPVFERIEAIPRRELVTDEHVSIMTATMNINGSEGMQAQLMKRELWMVGERDL